MRLDFPMWQKALNVIPEVSKDEWDRLDLVSRWLISTRAAVLIMTFLSAALAGIFALRVGAFQFLPWLALTFGLIMAHASNNIFNDFTDYVRGVDKDNYFRTIYGAQPVASGLLTKRQHLTYFFVTALLALLAGICLLALDHWDPAVWMLLAAGAFFVLFYTWPLKYLAMGEAAVLLVWGPLMIGGGYYVLARNWDWNVVIASLPYVLGVTTVIFGKHIDKLGQDQGKSIHTLTVIIGEKAARVAVMTMIALQYLLVIGLILTGYFSPLMLIVLIGLKNIPSVWAMFKHPKPAERPAEYPADAWPLWFSAAAFLQNRLYGLMFLLGLILSLFIHL